MSNIPAVNIGNPAPPGGARAGGQNPVAGGGLGPNPAPLGPNPAPPGPHLAPPAPLTWENLVATANLQPHEAGCAWAKAAESVAWEDTLLPFRLAASHDRERCHCCTFLQ